MSPKLIAGVFMALFWLFVITQVFWPMLTGKKLFPAFNKRRKELNERIQTAKEEEEIRAIESKANELESKLK